MRKHRLPARKRARSLARSSHHLGDGARIPSPPAEKKPKSKSKLLRATKRGGIASGKRPRLRADKPRRWRRHSGGTAATAGTYQAPIFPTVRNPRRQRSARSITIPTSTCRTSSIRVPTKIWTSPVRRMWTLNAILASSMHRFLGTKSRAPRPRIGASEVKAASRRRRTAWWGVVICAGLSATTAADARAETYAVLIRQIGGSESVPAHLVCEEGRVCLGQMSLSVEGGHRRIFIRGLIDGPYAYFKFRSDTQSLQCGSLEFITFQIAAPPNSTHYESGICDPPASAQLDAEGLRLPVLKSLPAFTTLRIDVRVRHNEALNR